MAWMPYRELAGVTPRRQPATRRLLLRTGGVLLLWLAEPSAAHACSCIESDASLTCDAMTPDAAIFSGTAVAFEPTTSASGQAMRRYTFQVGEAFHGLDGAPATVSVTVDAQTSCALSFQIGGRYLVFARRAGDGFETGRCTRTQRLADARADLDVLRDVMAGVMAGRLTGRVFDVRVPLERPGRPISFGGGTGVQGIDVVVSGPSGQRQVSSDAEGWFTLTGLPPGRYHVEARLPANRVARRARDEAVVGRCSSDVMLVTAARSFEGTVVDSDGRPARAGLRLSLIADAPGTPVSDAPRAWARTDNRGRLSVSGLPPGRYRFGISVAEPPTADTPFAPTWYGEATGGAVLEISDRQTTQAVLRLPPRLSTRTIEGVVADAAGGTPAGAVFVSVTDRDAPNFRVATVEATAGRFRFEGVTGRRYAVQAELSSGSRSAAVNVPDATAQAVTLVLPK